MNDHLTFSSDGFANDAADCLVKTEHVHEDTSDLWKEETAYRCTRSDVRLENICEDLDIIHATQDIHILGSLSHKRVPLENFMRRE